MKDAIKRFRERLLGLNSLTSRLEKELAATNKRIGALEKKFESVTASPTDFWLFLNREERMDATVPVFDEDRRRFHLARYEFAADYCESLNVADIACGTGYGARLLSGKGSASSVVGVDLDEEAVRYAIDRYGSKNTKFIVAGAEKTGLPSESFDLVVSFETIEHVADDRSMLIEFARILKPGGRLICSTPNEWPLAISSHHLREYDRDTFEKVLGEFFNVKAMFNQNSGSEFEFNRGQPEGIVETTELNSDFAECYIAICTKSL